MTPQAFVPLALLCAGLAQAGSATVVFEPSQRYTDVGPASDTEAVQQALSEQLQALAQARLPAHHSLVITITDIDLAGEIEPWSARFGGVRVLGRRVDWPRIDLRFTLSEGSRTLAEGSERVSDPAYLMRAGFGLRNARLPHEQRLLNTWFNQRFGAWAPH